MKKCLALLFVSAFVGSVASAQWLVYDYKANIHRVDNKISTVKYSADVWDQTPNASRLWDSYTTAYDDLKGYLVIPICIGCDAESGSEASLPYGESWLYAVRKADKTKSMWKLPAVVSSGLFNAGVTARPDTDALSESIAGAPTSLKKLNQAWMQVDFEYPLIDGLTAAHGSSGQLPYGFLGHGSADGFVVGNAFGSAKLLSSVSVEFCQEPTSISCMLVSTVEGHMASSVCNQQPVCGVAVMWDVCSLNSIGQAAMHGVWSVKLNNSVSTTVNNAGSLADAEPTLMTKLGATRMLPAAE